MPGRNTTTGGILEQTVIPALKGAGYDCVRNRNIGNRPSGKRHLIDVLATHTNGRIILVSLKWQQVSGTAEQKIPFEVICLADALKTSKGKYSKAYLVLGGPGWSLRDYYVSGGLDEHLKDSHLVDIQNLETFIATANQGNL